jgi:serine/threonine protein phosphatase PrpC
MEDSAVVVDPFMGEKGGVNDTEQWGFFAVYDGHGGRQAVDYTEAKLHEIVLNELSSARSSASNASSPSGGIGRWSDEAIGEAMTRAFQRVDDQLRLVGAWRCGCTATIVLVRQTQNATRLHVANVGDSRAVAVDSTHGEWRISRDHRPTDPAEVRRVEGEGGFVSRGRVAGQLGVSRALGDHALKGAGVSWRPFVSARDATQDVALIIASDGLWDAMSDADAKQTVAHCLAEQMPDKAAQQLVEDAQRRGSTDNITCLVAFFDTALQA